MWQIERRVHFLLSGKINQIPINAKNKANKLGFIQVPKLISAKLEESRLKSGRRTFASGSSTSYGIEDIWTNGLFTLENLSDLVTNMNTMLAIELALLLQIDDLFLNRTLFNNLFQKHMDVSSFRDQFDLLKNDNDKQQLPISYELQPFKKHT